jgi:hypothetical protein
MSTRLFTLDEAIATLPYVRRIAADLSRDYRAWQQVLVRYELTVMHRRPDADGLIHHDEADAIEQEAAALATRIQHYLDELAGVGAIAVNYGESGIDFPGVHAGHTVRWSWMLGEPTITRFKRDDDPDGRRETLDALVDTYSDGAR